MACVCREDKINGAISSLATQMGWTSLEHVYILHNFRLISLMIATNVVFFIDHSPDQSHPVDVFNIRLDIRRGLDGNAGSQRLRNHKEADKALVRKA